MKLLGDIVSHYVICSPDAVLFKSRRGNNLKKDVSGIAAYSNIPPIINRFHCTFIFLKIGFFSAAV